MSIVRKRWRQTSRTNCFALHSTALQRDLTVTVPIIKYIVFAHFGRSAETIVTSVTILCVLYRYNTEIFAQGVMRSSQYTVYTDLNSGKFIVSIQHQVPTFLSARIALALQSENQIRSCARAYSPDLHWYSQPEYNFANNRKSQGHARLIDSRRMHAAFHEALVIPVISQWDIWEGVANNY